MGEVEYKRPRHYIHGFLENPEQKARDPEHRLYVQKARDNGCEVYIMERYEALNGPGVEAYEGPVEVVDEYEYDSAAEEREMLQQVHERDLRDARDRRHRAYYLKNLLDRKAKLEADIERARSSLLDKDGNLKKNVGLKWLDWIGNAESQLADIRREMRQLTGDDDLYAARVAMAGAQANVLKGMTQAVLVQFSGVARPEALPEGGDDDDGGEPESD